MRTLGSKIGIALFAHLEQESAMNNQTSGMHAAVEHLDWPTVIAMIRGGQSIDVGDEQGNSPLANACRAGRIEAVRKLIQFGANVEATNDGGCN